MKEGLVIELRNSNEEADVRIPSSHAEFFPYAVEGWNRKLEHFQIDINKDGDFEWNGNTYDFCNVYPNEGDTE